MSRRVVLTLFVIGMLVSLLVQNAGRTAESDKANQSLKGNSSASMYDNVTIHEGDLIINGTQTFVIENCTFIQTGNIYVEDYAKLVVQNATLWLNQTHAFQFTIQVNISGILEAKDAYFTSQTNFGIYLNDFAQAEMSLATTKYQGYTSTLGAFILSDNSQMEMNDSKIQDVICYMSSLISIRNSIISEIVAFMNCTIKIYDSTVTSRLGVTGGATVAVYNCTVYQPWLIFSPYDTYFYSKADLQNLNPGYCQFWKITLNATVEGTGFDLTMQDVWINKGWSIEAYEMKVSISNSTIRLDSHFTSEVSIYNSTIYLLYMNLLYNSTLFFDATVITNIIVQGAQCYIHGNATFPMETTIDWIPPSTLPPHYPNNSIERDYNVIARRINGDAMGNATLTLSDKNNGLVWNGTTSNLGQANFNLTFTDNNYTDTLRLEAVEGNHSVIQNITFLSDTPVIVQIGILGDINGDWTVDIYDAIMLANAYNSKPNDPNWNPNADINSDNIVDIYDAIILANHYNQHYP